MKFSILKSVLLIAPMLAINTACIDDNYDLSNIDTTTQININDLEIPINLDAIKLNNLIEIDEDSEIQVYTDTEGNKYYAVKESGEFSSSEIYINEVMCQAPNVDPSVTTIDISSISIPGFTIPSLPNIPITPPAGIDVSFEVPTLTNEFNYDIQNIDPSIHSVKSIEIKPLKIRLNIALSGINNAVTDIDFKNLRITTPKGLNASVTEGEGTYNSSTGEISIPHLTSVNGVANIALTVTGIDFEVFGSSLDYDTHTLSCHGEINIVGGEIHATTTGQPIPSSITLTVASTFTDIIATSFTGEIEYLISGINVPNVDISGLPEFLSNSNTDISLINPQIYLSVNNPVGNYGLVCQTGITLSALRDNMPSKDFSINDAYFTIGADAGNGKYNFCLSPEKPSNPIAEFANNFTWVEFTDLSYLLAGEGLPKAIGITLNNPCIPTQSVTEFKLGTTLDGVQGNYELFAPLALIDGSSIVYSATETGLNEDELNNLVINKLEINANVTTNIPLQANITASLLDKNGNTLNATISCSEIPAQAQDAPITISLQDGVTVKDLDGITFTATVVADGETALSPDMTITLRNVRAKVSGHYTKKI